MSIIHKIKTKIRDRKVTNKKRSSQWPKVRKEHLEEHPNCAVCGSDKKVEVHHCKPFHTNPDLELNPENLITLCDGARNGNHHLIFGHFCDFKKENLNVKKDAAYFYENIIK